MIKTIIVYISTALPDRYCGGDKMSLSIKKIGYEKIEDKCKPSCSIRRMQTVSPSTVSNELNGDPPGFGS